MASNLHVAKGFLTLWNFAGANLYKVIVKVKTEQDGNEFSKLKTFQTLKLDKYPMMCMQGSHIFSSSHNSKTVEIN